MSTDVNPFDITKGANTPNPLTTGAAKKTPVYVGKKKYAKKDYSQEQIRGLLSGYIEVDRYSHQFTYSLF
jgi:hypothetical protein